MYKEERSSSRENTIPQRRRTPSFSSTLLDAIYRSIDESNGVEEEVTGGVQYRETTMVKKQSNSVSTIRRDTFLEDERHMSSLGRAVMIESWMEKQSTRSSTHYNSTSSSSDSSSGRGGGAFSSSEAESSCKTHSRPRRSSSCTPQRSKPVSEKKQHQKANSEGGFSKTKLKALKIYCELKKVKQPISPGGRISSFLNSIFSPGSGKKVKMCSVGATDDVTFERKSKSTCSSVTSFSRSCLSKTPPSRGKSGNGSTKRSVRFYPVGIIVDEDSRPCGHKCIYDEDPGLMPMPQRFVRSKSKREEVGRGADYLRSYHQKTNNKVNQCDFRDFQNYAAADDDTDSDDDDVESCSSSDLFELDHLIGIGRYREELPVYETTNLKTNQAIANGFIL